MSTFKTVIDQDKVLTYLKHNFDESVADLTYIKGGEGSQAFSFTASDGDYVIRINTRIDPFYKDAYAFDHFASKHIPIPRIFEIGKIDDTYTFAISKKVEGRIINDLTHGEFMEVLPDFFSVLDAIHATDIRHTAGYGKWNIDGEGEYDTWHEFLLGVGKYNEKNKLFEESFLEKDFWDEVVVKMEKLADFCPEDRFLIHADFGNSNVMAQKSPDGVLKISGVFDWAESKFGDFLYDIAWILFWLKNPESFQAVKDFYAKMELPNFEERLQCYQIRIGLNSMAFFAYSKQKEKYDRAKAKLVSLL